MTLQCDVLVVGAGVAGVPAAVAAVRSGADTLLVERRATPGGAGVVGLHRHICGLYSNAAIPHESLLNGGLVSEVCERLHAMAPDTRPVRLGKVDVLPYVPAQLQKVFADMIADEKRLRVLFGTTVSRFHLEAGRIRGVAAGDTEIAPRVVIDCSGDGAVIQCDPALHEPAEAKIR